LEHGIIWLFLKWFNFILYSCSPIFWIYTYLYVNFFSYNRNFI